MTDAVRPRDAQEHQEFRLCWRWPTGQVDSEGPWDNLDRAHEAADLFDDANPPQKIWIEQRTVTYSPWNTLSE